MPHITFLYNQILSQETSNPQDQNEPLDSAAFESIEIQPNTQHTHFQTASKNGDRSRIRVEPYTTLSLAFSKMLLRSEPYCYQPNFHSYTTVFHHVIIVKFHLFQWTVARTRTYIRLRTL